MQLQMIFQGVKPLLKEPNYFPGFPVCHYLSILFCRYIKIKNKEPSSSKYKNEKWKSDFSQIDTNGLTFVDSKYSKAYLRHLFSINENLGKQIATIHNLGFYSWLIKKTKEKILDGDFDNWKNTMVKKLDNKL